MRKRRTKYQWLQPLGATGPAGNEDDNSNGVDFGAFNVETTGRTTGVVVPLLADEPSDDVPTPSVMVQNFQFDYFIKRIVGKIFINQTQDGTAEGIGVGGAGSILVGFGLFIARVQDENAGVGNNRLPIGIGATNFGTTAEALLYSPLTLDVIREPWIWRRTWLLSNRISTSTTAITSFPATNVDYGSIQDGAHIDAKTARRVRDDERLFGIVAAKVYPLNVVQNDNPVVRAYLDYRVLGAPRRHRQKSSF